MGSFSNIFGKVPKVLVLEAFAEDPDEQFTAPEIMRITGISRRAAYLIIKKFVEEGLLVAVDSHRGAASYALNNSDLRAVVLKRIEPLLVMGKLESELKLEEGIPSADIYPRSYLNDLIIRPQPDLRIAIEGYIRDSRPSVNGGISSVVLAEKPSGMSPNVPLSTSFPIPSTAGT